MEKSCLSSGFLAQSPFRSALLHLRGRHHGAGNVMACSRSFQCHTGYGQWYHRLKCRAAFANSTQSMQSDRPLAAQCRAVAADVEPAGASTPLPRTAVEMAAAARQALTRALAAGRLRQRIDFVLPVNEKETSFMATEPLDYPCSLQREFDACCDLARLMLSGGIEGVVKPGEQLLSRRIDSGGIEGEPCTVIYPESKTIAAVVFPTADRLNQIKSLAKEADRPLLIVNPQWKESGQVVSDFGIGPWRQAAMDFLDTFEPSYVLIEQRIGAPGSIDAAKGNRYESGGVVRVQRSFPDDYQVHVVAPTGASQLAGSFDHKPSYDELDKMLRSARAAGMDIFEVARKATSVLASVVREREREAAEAAAAEPAATEAGGALMAEEIDVMDAHALRRALTALGLPSSGKLAKLRERLKEAITS